MNSEKAKAYPRVILSGGKSKTKKDNCLIVCNGEFSKKLLEKFTSLSSSSKNFTVIACDGAANTLKKYSAVPDFITGDMDSILPKTLAYYQRKKITIKKVINQNKTDLEKALDLALKMKLNNITIIGYGGKRIDHTINNFSLLKKYSDKCNIRYIDNEFEIFYSGKLTEFKYKKGEIVSLIGMPKAVHVKTTGLKWELKNETLEFGKHQSALNICTSDTVRIEGGTGNLLLFKKHFGEINNIF